LTTLIQNGKMIETVQSSLSRFL